MVGEVGARAWVAREALMAAAAWMVEWRAVVPRAAMAARAADECGSCRVLVSDGVGAGAREA